MKTIKKNVYYCEFCNKHGLSSYHLLRHEKSCTLNKHRYCRMCDSNYEDKKLPPLDDVLKLCVKGEWGMWDTAKAVALLEGIFDGCPACLLTYIRTHQNSKLAEIGLNWDYKTACDAWWKEVNAEADWEDRMGY